MRRSSLLTFVLVTTGLVTLPGLASAQTSPSPYTAAHLYDSLGREVGTISPSADGVTAPFLAVRKTFNADGRLVKVESGYLSTWQPQSALPGGPSGWTGFTITKTTVTSYNSSGQNISEAILGSDGNPYSLTQYSYDAAGQLQCEAVRMNPAIYSNLPASACTLGTPGSQGPDRISRNVFDSAGRLVQIRRAVGTSIEEAYVTYAYSTNGKQTDYVDANGNHARFDYDGFDRQAMWTFPANIPASAFDGSTQLSAISTANALSSTDYEAYSYDESNNRLTQRKRDGSVLSFSYDALNRMTVKTVPQRANLAATNTRSVFFRHDMQGRQLSAWFDTATSGQGVSNSYDALGRQTSTTLSMDGSSRTLNYNYDLNGNRTRVTFPDTNYANYAFDGLDRPKTITTSAGTTPASYAYNPDGTRASYTSNGTASNTTYGYDNVGRLASLNNAPANAAYGNVFGFQYNYASQISLMTKSNNLYAFSGIYGVNRPYSVNGLNQYNCAGAVCFSYDLNGNLLSDGSNNYLYDIESRLVSVTGAHSATLRYDPLGRLYEVVNIATNATTRFLYDGDALVAEYDAAGNLLRRYVHGADSQSDDPLAWYEGAGFSSSNERLLRPNWEGSIESVTDSTGQAIFAANAYDEYGIPGASDVTP